MCQSESSIQGVEVSSLKKAQSWGDSWQEALEGPVRPGKQISSLCEGGSDQPIRNQGSIPTTRKAGLTASAAAVSTGGASGGGFSTHSEQAEGLRNRHSCRDIIQEPHCGGGRASRQGS